LLAAAAILLDRPISLFSIIIICFVVFMIAFGRQAGQTTRQPKLTKSSTQK